MAHRRGNNGNSVRLYIGGAPKSLQMVIAAMKLKDFTPWKESYDRPSESKVTQSCPTLVNPWTVAYQVPLSTGFPRQEYWSGLPFSSTRDLPDPGTEPGSPTMQADSLPSEPPGK